MCGIWIVGRSYEQTYPQKLGRGFCGNNIADSGGLFTVDKPVFRLSTDSPGDKKIFWALLVATSCCVVSSWAWAARTSEPKARYSWQPSTAQMGFVGSAYADYNTFMFVGLQ
jgi:hypothetical protein